MSADLRTIATFSDPIEAEFVANRLEEAGIAVAVSGDMTASTFSGLGYMAGGVDVLVHASEIDRARTVLEEFSKELEAKKHRPPHAITAAPPIPEMEEEIAPGTGPDSPTTSEEDLTDRAFKASIFGYLLCTPFIPVLHIYSLLVLLYVAISGTETRPGSTARFYVAMALSAISVALGAVMMMNLFSDSWISWLLPVWISVAIAVTMFVFTILYPRKRK